MKEGSCDHDFLRQLCTAQRFSSMIIVRLLSTRAFWLVCTTEEVYSGVGAGVVMESISLAITAKVQK